MDGKNHEPDFVAKIDALLKQAAVASTEESEELLLQSFELLPHMNEMLVAGAVEGKLPPAYTKVICTLGLVILSGRQRRRMQVS